MQPISFVVVRYSDECDHNILQSACVRDPRNELILVDNPQGFAFDNLTQAINTAYGRLTHHLVAIVHEDVYLAPEWQSQLQESLRALEAHDPNWGLVGVAGWNLYGELEGHFRDPRNHANTFSNIPFKEVERVDEHMMLLRRSPNVKCDPLIPGIHGIGRDLAATARAKGLRTYVVNAKTHHKYADGSGHLIQNANESQKLVERKKYTNVFAADRACSDEYLDHKWSAVFPQDQRPAASELTKDHREVLDRAGPPVVLLARGGSGSRLLSLAAQDCGLFVGNETNPAGDALEMVMAVYQGVLRKYLCPAEWQEEQITPHLQSSASEMLQKGEVVAQWGFKLPEMLLILPEIRKAFPGSRLLHLVRDPLTTCLRRTHMTARLDNKIGRLGIALGYRHAGLDPRQSLNDSPALHMAYTTRHQLETVLEICRALPRSEYVELRFEDAVAQPGAFVESVATWLGTTVRTQSLSDSVDKNRANNPSIRYSAAVERKALEILAPLRARLGYTE